MRPNTVIIAPKVYMRYRISRVIQHAKTNLNDQKRIKRAFRMLVNEKINADEFLTRLEEFEQKYKITKELK